MTKTTVFTNSTNDVIIRITTPVQRSIETGRRPGIHGLEFEVTSWDVIELSAPAWAKGVVRIDWTHYFNGVITNDGSCGGLDNVASLYEHVLGEQFDPAILAPLFEAQAVAA